MAAEKISELLKQTTKTIKPNFNIYLGIQGKHLFIDLGLLLNRTNNFHHTEMLVT